MTALKAYIDGDWVEVFAGGEAGGPGLEFTGEWDAETEYVFRQAVFHEGSSYYCVEDNTGEEPQWPLPDPVYWAPLALMGAAGSDPLGPVDVVEVEAEWDDELLAYAYTVENPALVNRAMLLVNAPEEETVAFWNGASEYNFGDKVNTVGAAQSIAWFATDTSTNERPYRGSSYWKQMTYAPAAVRMAYGIVGESGGDRIEVMSLRQIPDYSALDDFSGRGEWDAGAEYNEDDTVVVSQSLGFGITLATAHKCVVATSTGQSPLESDDWVYLSVVPMIPCLFFISQDASEEWTENAFIITDSADPFFGNDVGAAVARQKVTLTLWLSAFPPESEQMFDLWIASGTIGLVSPNV